jgi:flagellar M-ring protein FliF
MGRMDLTRQWKDWLNRWQAMSLGRKILWIVVGGACLLMAMFFWWVSQPEYRVLYTGLSAEESGAITSKLQGKGVAYKLAAGGSNILVAADQVMQVHVDLTTEGIPGSSKIGRGLELFDQPSFGTTSFNQHVNFLRAQQSELARTIMQIDPIIFARVHIVCPEKSPFMREQQPTTASVMVKLRPGANLNRSTVAGIGALVAGSVEGLPRENVRIIDASGRLLSDRGDPDGGTMGSSIEQRKEIEQYLAGEAEHMLEHVLGSGKAIVRVTAELNPKLMHEKKDMIIAEGRVARTEKTTLKKTNGESTGKGGAAGASSNLGKQGGGAAGGNGSKIEETQQSDYDYPRTMQEWQQKHAAIDRLTIAAFVDLGGGDDKSISLDDIKETIKKAVGFKLDRDEIQITLVKMPTKSADDFEKEWASYQQWQTVLSIIRNASVGMIALCAVPLVWVVLRRRASSQAVVAPQETAEVIKLRTISAAFERNPEALANILSRWLERAESTEQKVA